MLGIKGLCHHYQVSSLFLRQALSDLGWPGAQCVADDSPASVSQTQASTLNSQFPLEAQALRGYGALE